MMFLLGLEFILPAFRDAVGFHVPLESGMHSASMSRRHKHQCFAADRKRDSVWVVPRGSTRSAIERLCAISSPFPPHTCVAGVGREGGRNG
jgi:hypothetical protein